MKVGIFTLLFLIGSSFGFSQTVTLKPNQSGNKIADSVNVFYKALFKALKRGYVHRKSLDWHTIEQETYIKLSHYDRFEDSLKEITNVFDLIGADHCQVYHAGIKYTATRKQVSKQLYSDEWRAKYESKPIFEVKLLDEKYGYILIPRIITLDNSPETLGKIAQPLYDQIAKLKLEHAIAGWVIDLRFTTGGNAAPMILALYDLLGDHVVWTGLNENKNVIDEYELAHGRYLYHSKLIAAIEPEGKLFDKAKVALITGILTASSGEVTALAFKGRDNTIFIGEKTAGYTTSNVNWPLPYDTFIALSSGYDGDRTGRYYPCISPDVVISGKDNFKDLMSDANVREAIRFFDAE